jgi:suppressor of G2 allele of SKP1
VGLKWSALEGTEIITIDPAASKIAHPVKTSAQDPTTPTTVKAPSYPTSSKTGPKDWDALATEELRKTRSAKDGEKEINDGEDDDMEGDPVNGFFKKIYGSADPDTRRAMMKSFTESNGTALSTNWGEVGSKTFETKPPEGVEAKKWSS